MVYRILLSLFRDFGRDFLACSVGRSVRPLLCRGASAGSLHAGIMIKAASIDPSVPGEVG